MNTVIIPNDNDVLSGRGNARNKHPGNVSFRALVATHKDHYCDHKTTNNEKSRIVLRIIDQVINGNTPGRFLIESSSGNWQYLDSEARLKKTAQALRDNNKIEQPIEIYNPDNDRSLDWGELERECGLNDFGQSTMNTLMKSHMSLDLHDMFNNSTHHQHDDSNIDFMDISMKKLRIKNLRNIGKMKPSCESAVQPCFPFPLQPGVDQIASPSYMYKPGASKKDMELPYRFTGSSNALEIYKNCKDQNEKEWSSSIMSPNHGIKAYEEENGEQYNQYTAPSHPLNEEKNNKLGDHFISPKLDPDNNEASMSSVWSCTCMVLSSRSTNAWVTAEEDEPQNSSSSIDVYQGDEHNCDQFISLSGRNINAFSEI